MKIAIDARESGTSTGRYVDKLIEHLHKLKPTEKIIVLTKADRVGFIKSVAPGFEVIESNYKEFTFAEQVGLRSQLRRVNADLVHFTMTQQPIYYYGKSVTTVHDLITARFTNPAKNWLIYKFKQVVYRFVIVWVAHKSKLVITPTNFVRDDLSKFAHLKKSKIVVTYEAADKINDAAEPVKDLADKKFLMYVGRPTPHKNLITLVKALEILAAQDPQLLLVLAGKKDANYSSIEKAVAKMGLTDRVIFTGFISDGQLRWLYENTAVYVFPSLAEGFGLPGLEAMAHGAPVAASRATTLPEIYGTAAHYFDPKSADDMASKIREILNNPELRQKLVKAGVTQSAKYSWQAMAEQTLALYRKMLD
jgi:glycosyltransferase involved in cell wall biosynthesis